MDEYRARARTSDYPSMRIGLVAERFSSASGVGPERYSWELRRVLMELALDVRWVQSNPPTRRFALALNSITKVPVETISLLRKVDVLHATDPSSALILPICGKKSVVTFHDSMALLYKGGQFSGADRVFSNLVYRLSALCDAIIAVSEQTKAELVHALNVPSQRVTVVHPGVSNAFKRIPILKEKPPTIGYVGSLNPRKRVDYLLEGFNLLKVRYGVPARLIIVGRGGELQKLKRLTSSLGLEDFVSFLGSVTDVRLNELYNQMTVLVLPSDYEGFGFPILEAQTCGTPVVIREDARISPEVALSCVKVGATQDLAETLNDLLTDKRRLQEIADEGVNNALRFTWAECARKTAAVYASLLST